MYAYYLDSSSSKSVFERIGASCDREKKSPGLVSKSGMFLFFKKNFILIKFVQTFLSYSYNKNQLLFLFDF